MIKIDGVTLRGLEEQVQQNKQDIAEYREVDHVLEAFGIQIQGQLDTPEELPEDEGENYGYAYLVGAEAPLDTYVWTRPNPNTGHIEAYWMNLGPLSIVGPQGLQGEQGEQGPIGLTGHSLHPEETIPTSLGTYTEGDLIFLTGEEGRGLVYIVKNGEFKPVGSILGPRGIQGVQGLQGVQGIQGVPGPKGDKGDVGAFIHIIGEVDSVEQLPTPEALADITAAYLVGDDKNLYIQVGESVETALWTDMGQLNVATMVLVNGEFVGQWNADTKQDKLILKDPIEFDSDGKLGLSQEFLDSISASYVIEQATSFAPLTNDDMAIIREHFLESQIHDLSNGEIYTPARASDNGSYIYSCTERNSVGTGVVHIKMISSAGTVSAVNYNLNVIPEGDGTVEKFYLNTVHMYQNVNNGSSSGSSDGKHQLTAIYLSKEKAGVPESLTTMAQMKILMAHMIANNAKATGILGVQTYAQYVSAEFQNMVESSTSFTYDIVYKTGTNRITNFATSVSAGGKIILIDHDPDTKLKWDYTVQEVEIPIKGALRYDIGQSLTDEQKSTARLNIGVGGGSIKFVNGSGEEVETVNLLTDEIVEVPLGEGKTYTAGDGIIIDSNDAISVDTEEVATKDDLNDYVTTTTKVNGKALDSNIDLVGSDINLDNENSIQENFERVDGLLAEAMEDIEDFNEALSYKADKSTTINGYDLNGDITLVKSDVGLGNVDNTSDANKPISTAQQAAFDAITAKIPSDASSTNKLVSSNTMSDAINSVTAYPIYKDASQNNFATKAQLLAATTFYTADGQVRVPTKNDYTYVLADETHSNHLARYVVTNTTPSIVWGFQVEVSTMEFSQAQLDAINSGVTSGKVSGYDTHVANKVSSWSATPDDEHYPTEKLIKDTLNGLIETSTPTITITGSNGVTYSDIQCKCYKFGKQGITPKVIRIYDIMYKAKMPNIQSPVDYEIGRISGFTGSITPSQMKFVGVCDSGYALGMFHSLAYIYAMRIADVHANRTFQCRYHMITEANS